MAPKDMEMEDQDDHLRTPIPSSEAEAVDCDRDHALATALQEQEREFAMLETTESDDEDDEGDEDEYYEDGDESYLPSADDFEGGFFTSQELADLELLEEEEDEEDEEDEDELEEDSNTEEEEEEEDDEDEIDPDELSYEDLIALGEIVGQENQGLTPEEIIPTLSPYICQSIHSNTGIDKCVICQVEYEEGEGVVALRCDHPFHDACINQWLQIKKICPICCKEAVKQKTE